MELLDKIENLSLKRRAVESVSADEANRELISDRIIVMLEGDIRKLDMLVGGIPYDFINASERLKAETYIASKIDNFVKLVSISREGYDILRARYLYTAKRYIKPGDEEARKAVEAGKYSDNAKYYKDSEYSEEVCYEDSSFQDISVHELETAGVKFNKL